MVGLTTKHQVNINLNFWGAYCSPFLSTKKVSEFYE